jgi:nucleotide-binding universal stress UspA family protein
MRAAATASSMRIRSPESRSAVQARVSSRDETWVHEKGLPRVCREPSVSHLGQRLLVATDLTEASRPAEEQAMQIAEETGARLVILAVAATAGDDRDTPARRLAQRIRSARKRGIDVAGQVAVGDPGQRVVEAAVAIGADAIIISPRQWERPREPGCPCGHIIRHAPCTVLITGER